MSADMERKSGIAATHVGSIAATAREVNAFILIRKTNLDATRLIRMGYATKSMDIHDKSSDWRPRPHPQCVERLRAAVRRVTARAGQTSRSCHVRR
jgi:hypothetical protein